MAGWRAETSCAPRESWLIRLESERQIALTALLSERDTALRARRLARAEQSIVVRTEVNRRRLQLLDFARERCGSVRATLRSALATTRRRDLVAFTRWAVATLADLGDEVVCEADRHLGATGPGATGLGVADAGTPNTARGRRWACRRSTPDRHRRARHREVVLAVLLGGASASGWPSPSGECWWVWPRLVDGMRVCLHRDGIDAGHMDGSRQAVGHRARGRGSVGRRTDRPRAGEPGGLGRQADAGGRCEVECRGS